MLKKLQGLSTFFGYVSAVTLAVLVLLVVYDATLRYLLHSGSIALQELEWHFFDVVILLGIAYTLKHNAHVRVDIFYDRFPKKLRLWVNLLGTFFFILPFSVLIIYMGFDFVMMSFDQLEASSNPGGLPYRYIVKSLMPLAFIFLVLQAFMMVLENFSALRKEI